CLRNEAHQYNKPQQKAGANTSIILGHFQKRLTPLFPHISIFFSKSFPHSSWIADQLFHKACLLSPPYTRPSTTGVFWNNNLYTL
ncbi:MAG: hypothetical protein KH214_14035, partial [Ruminococcus sp.]|nr:hypothetical protein [Ruminococcus sp.]